MYLSSGDMLWEAAGGKMPISDKRINTAAMFLATNRKKESGLVSCSFSVAKNRRTVLPQVDPFSPLRAQKKWWKAQCQEKEDKEKAGSSEY